MMRSPVQVDKFDGTVTKMMMKMIQARPSAGISQKSAGRDPDLMRALLPSRNPEPEPGHSVTGSRSAGQPAPEAVTEQS
eukprot:456398-Rhodomonas_salina.3